MTYDVVLFINDGRRDDGMVLGFNCQGASYKEAENAFISLMQRLSDHYSAAIVESGSVQAGDKLTEDMTR